MGTRLLLVSRSRCSTSTPPGYSLVRRVVEPRPVVEPCSGGVEIPQGWELLPPDDHGAARARLARPSPRVTRLGRRGTRRALRGSRRRTSG